MVGCTLLGVALAALGRYVLDDIRVTAFGAALTILALGILLLNFNDWKDDGP